MLYLFVPLVLAIAPAVLLLRYFLGKDKEKPEPRGRVMLVFFGGVISIIPAIILELIVSRIGRSLYLSPYLTAAFDAFIVAGLVEEYMKLTVVKITAYNRGVFDEYSDGIMYAVTAGLGFACFENVMYVINGGLTVALVRAFTSIPLHACASGIMGFFIGKARFSSGRREESRLLRIGLFLAVIIHGYYNFALFLYPIMGLLPLLTLIPLLVSIFIILERCIKKAKELDEAAGFIQRKAGDG